MSCTCVVAAEWPESRINVSAPGQGFANRRRPISVAVKLWLNIVGVPEWKFTVYPNQNQANDQQSKGDNLVLRGNLHQFFIKKKIGSRFARCRIRKVYLPGQLIYVWTFFSVSLTGRESLTPTCRFMIKETIMPINSRSGIMSLVRRPVCGDCLASPSFCSN